MTNHNYNKSHQAAIALTEMMMRVLDRARTDGDTHGFGDATETVLMQRIDKNGVLREVRLKVSVWDSNPNR
jgi:hypothetical protein